MGIDHIAIYVRDLEKSKMFYEKYFGGKANDQYHNPRTGLRTYFLTFEDGSRLEIMSKPDLLSCGGTDEQYGYAHLAFRAGCKETVDNLTDRLRSDGYLIFSKPRVTGDGYYESCISDPDLNRIEIVA